MLILVSICVCIYIFLALFFTGPYCCDSPNHIVNQAEEFDPSYWIPRLCNHSDDLGVGSSEVTKPRTRTLYRPLSERRELTGILEDWRLKIYKAEPSNSLFPIDDILGSQRIVALARLLPDSPPNSLLVQFTDFLGQSKEWNAVYAPQVFKIISDYNLTRPQKIRRPKKEVEWAANMHIFSSSVPQSQALSQTPAPQSSSSRTRMSILSRGSLDKRQNPGTPNSTPPKPTLK